MSRRRDEDVHEVDRLGPGQLLIADEAATSAASSAIQITDAPPRDHNAMGGMPDGELPEFLLVHGAWHAAWAFDALGRKRWPHGRTWRTSSA